MRVNITQRVITPIQHQVISLCRLAFNATPTAMQMGAPTDIVPTKPKPMMPNLSQRRCSMGCFGASFFLGLFLKKKFLILSPKKALTNTPINPPVTLAKKMIHGDNLKANPAGIAA